MAGMSEEQPPQQPPQEPIVPAHEHAETRLEFDAALAAAKKLRTEHPEINPLDIETARDNPTLIQIGDTLDALDDKTVRPQERGLREITNLVRSAGFWIDAGYTTRPFLNAALTELNDADALLSDTADPAAREVLRKAIANLEKQVGDPALILEEKLAEAQRHVQEKKYLDAIVLLSIAKNDPRFKRIKGSKEQIEQLIARYRTLKDAGGTGGQ